MRTVVRNNPVLLPVWNAAERGVPYLPTKDEVAQIQSAAGKNPEGVWQVLQHCLSAVLVEAGRSGDIKSASQALAFINQIYTSGATDKATKRLLQKSIKKALSSDDPTQVVALPELLTNARQAGLALELGEVFKPLTRGWTPTAFAVAAVSVLYKATKLDSPSFTKFIHSEEGRTYIGRWCDSLENEILKTQGEELRSIWTAVKQGH